VEVVAPGFSVFVEEAWWQEFGQAVGGDADLPPGTMQQPVMQRTQQHQVAQVRGTAISPVADVVTVGMPG